MASSGMALDRMPRAFLHSSATHRETKHVRLDPATVRFVGKSIHIYIYIYIYIYIMDVRTSTEHTRYSTQSQQSQRK